MYDEMRALQGRAEARRGEAGKAFSQREIEKALKKPPYSITFRGKALSEWVPTEVAKAQVPQDADVVLALVRLWSDWAEEGQPNGQYWRRLVERAQPARGEHAAADRSAAKTGGRSGETVLVDEDRTQLEAYLADVCRQAETSEPYVAQSVVSWHDGRPADPSMVQPASAAVFTSAPLVVVLGDPGGGKTELLRRHLLDVCRQWGNGVRSAALPVLVHAPLLSEAPLAAPFFAHPPAPGSHWLVLLDGLDEITNAQARREVLRDTVRWAAERRETHRLVIATRHLSEEEQSDLREVAPVCFELLRLEAGDVRELAAAWLGPDHVDSLMAAVAEARLADLVKLPMIGAIVCQLHRAHPDRPLGSTRGEIYDFFISQLMATTPRTDTRPEHHAGKQGDTGAPAWRSPTVGERVVALGTLPPADLRTLLETVAARRRESSVVRSVLDVLLEQDLAKPPGGVPVKWWREQLIACFRRSGVLQQQGEELEFAHRTYEEFLAACAFGDPRERGLTELRRVLDGHRHRHWPWRPAPGYRLVGAWGQWMWASAYGENTSYLGFLIDRLADSAAADLGKLPSSAGISGCTFLAAQKRLGTYLPAEVQARAVQKLKQHIKVGRRGRFGASIDIDGVNQLDPGSVPMAETLAALAIDDSRVDAASALLAFAESRAEGLGALRELALSPRLTSVQGQMAAATAIVRAGDESGLDLIVDLASNPGLDHDVRLGIACQLTDLRRQRGLDLLASWIDARAEGEFWFKAAIAVVAIDEAYGVARLKAIADDPACPALTRINAAYVVALHSDPRGAEDLLRFARDPDLEEQLRVVAVHLGAKVGHPSAMAVRDELAQDPNLTPRGRRLLRRLASAE
ncbi:NACHT domain-containing protein [Streptomyces sp. NPDC001502]|uniref:NACHT domain-containing protein n=1 Tax=Streptomyces sp. NPDC001502 TaxID=3364578 RepID=UPI0036BB6EAF